MFELPLSIPELIPTTHGMLRRWDARDAEGLKAAIDESLEGLKAWVPWGAAEPSELPAIAERLEKFQREFGTNGNWGFGIFDPRGYEVLGGIGLHGRVGPTAIEIGYWVRRSSEGQGIACASVRALTQTVMTAGVNHVEIHCDPSNAASARVAAKCGYGHAETRRGDYVAMGAPRDTMVWVWPSDAMPFRPPAAEERGR